MQTHTAKNVSNLLSNYLPHGYSNEVVQRAKEIGRDTYKDWVRQVKNLLKKDLQILNILIELASEQKAVAEAEQAKFKKLITKS